MGGRGAGGGGRGLVRVVSKWERRSHRVLFQGWLSHSKQRKGRGQSETVLPFSYFFWGSSCERLPGTSHARLTPTPGLLCVKQRGRGHCSHCPVSHRKGGIPHCTGQPSPPLWSHLYSVSKDTSRLFSNGSWLPQVLPQVHTPTPARVAAWHQIWPDRPGKQTVHKASSPWGIASLHVRCWRLLPRAGGILLLSK